MSGEPLVAFPARLSAPVFVRRSPSRPPLTPAALASFLPSTPGALPYFFLLTSAASIYNAAQNYFILWQTKEIYSAKAHEGGSAPVLPQKCPCLWRDGLLTLVRRSVPSRGEDIRHVDARFGCDPGYCGLQHYQPNVSAAYPLSGHLSTL
jgi:hypothetical protein